MKTYRWHILVARSDTGALLALLVPPAEEGGRWWCGVRGPKWCEDTEDEARTAVDRVLAKRGWTAAGEGA